MMLPAVMFDDVYSNASWSMVDESVREDRGLVERMERWLVEVLEADLLGVLNA